MRCRQVGSGQLEDLAAASVYDCPMCIQEREPLVFAKLRTVAL
jgi:hypothetical protein